MKQPDDQSPPEAKAQLHLATAQAVEVEVEFQDGVRVLPDYLVLKLGGAAVVTANLATFKQITYQNFMTAYGRSQERLSLNRLGTNYVNQALKRRR